MDVWAMQVERMSDPGGHLAISVTVASRRGRPARIGVEVHDRSVVPGAAVEAYPSGLVAGIAGRIPVLQNGRRLVRDPIVLDTDEAMRGLLNRLVDPARDMPFAMASIPPDEPDMDLLSDQWTALARALAGLAVVWVLPTQMTFRLSDTVGKPLSVYMGSWRFYRPGFNDRADQWRHPLVVVNRLSEEGGPDMATTQFQRLAAEERSLAEETNGSAPEGRSGAGEGVRALRRKLWVVDPDSCGRCVAEGFGAWDALGVDHALRRRLVVDLIAVAASCGAPMCNSAIQICCLDEIVVH